MHFQQNRQKNINPHGAFGIINDQTELKNTNQQQRYMTYEKQLKLSQ